ncbi:MAG: hypothetical protein O6952_02725 [Planctomycetota bacterium]|nr:hypothetical protein [Planctomycetota bacterium]
MVLLPSLISIITMTTGCQTTVGNYLANRGRICGDPWGRLSRGGCNLLKKTQIRMPLSVA